MRALLTPALGSSPRGVALAAALAIGVAGASAVTLAPAPLLAAGVAKSGAKGSVAMFSLSIGYNHSTNKARRDLKYADDDAVQSYLLMRSLGARAALLARLDAATKELHPSLSPTAPTMAALRTALATLNKLIDAARARGRPTVLYLFYSGHGDVDRGEGYVQLQGSRLPRSRLLALLRASHAQRNHVIIDACKSYYLVFSRGPGGRRRRASGRFLPRETRVPANTGFLLSTSSAQDSHEWEAYQGGVFSHEVRSALRGAADLDRDGRVSYEEVAAFIYTANKAVPNRRFRPRFFVRPPSAAAAGGSPDSAARAPLVDLRAVASRRIVFPASLARHVYIEDASGTRLADLHPARRPLTVMVPRGKLFVRDPRAHTEYAVAAGPRRVVLAKLAARPTSSRARGAEHESFRRLFVRPFDASALRAYRGRRPDAIDEPPPGRSWAHRWLRPGLGVLALASVATAATFTGLAVHERGRVEPSTPNADRQEINARIRRDNAIAVTLYAVGAAAAASYLIWTLWPEPKVKVQVSSVVLPGGGWATMSVRW